MLDPARIDDVLRRGGDVGTAVSAWKSLDERRRKLQNELDTMRQARNAANERMAKLDKKSAEFVSARDELKALSGKIKEGEATFTTLDAQRMGAQLVIPKPPHASVPTSTRPADSPRLQQWGAMPSLPFERI